MAFLIIFRADQGRFSEVEALRNLAAIGVNDLKRAGMPGAALAGHFRHGTDSVMVELKSGLKTFAISDSSPAGFEFALRLQSCVPEPLRIVDEGYSFDLELKNFSTASQLQEAVRLFDNRPPDSGSKTQQD